MPETRYSKMMDLTGKVAVVTGAGGVLCSRISAALAEQGAKIALLDLRPDAAEAAANNIRKAGGEAMAVECNVLEPDSIAKAVESIGEKFGVCDILVNGAGGNSAKATTSIETMSAEDLKTKAADAVTFFDLDPNAVQFVFNLNFLGTLLPSQAFIRSMMSAEGGGVVLNVSSMSAFSPLTKVPGYSAAKAAVSNFTKWLAVHFAPAGIRVNAIAPGFFLTEQNRFLLQNEDGSITARGQKILDHTPMRRYGKPEDLFGTVLWLVSDLSAFVTGTVIAIDGGFDAYSGV